MNKDDTFRTRFVAAIEGALGSNALDVYSIDELRTVLALSVSRESIRKYLAGHTPRPRVQAQLLAQIATAATRRGATDKAQAPAETFKGETTRREVLDLLGRDASFYQVTQRQGLPPTDFVIQQLGGQQILVRCLDDRARAELAHETYYAATLQDLAQLLTALDLGRGLLISHASPSPGASRLASKYNVHIQPYADFVKSVIPFEAVARTYQKRLEARLLDISYQPLPMTHVTRQGDSQCNNSYETLSTFLDRPRGPVMATVLGSYGSGKTSLLLKVAHRLAERSAEAGQDDWMLPLWLDARNSHADSIESDVAAALSAIAPSCRLSGTTLHNLIQAGRVALLVDGLDESPRLRSKAKLRHFIATLLKHGGPNCSLILTARQELFRDRAEELAILEDCPVTNGARRTLLLRTQVLEQSHIEHILRQRFHDQPDVATELLSELSKQAALRDLVSRPIFLHMLAQTGLHAIPNHRLSVLSLFESYVRRWADDELGRTSLALASENRLRMCEWMALHAERYGDATGISAEDVERVAREHGKKISVTDLEAFAAEARVAMFLERHKDDDRFSFSHPSLRSFFLARLVGREAAEGRFAFLEEIALTCEDPLRWHFIIEKMLDERKDPLVVLGTQLTRCLSWEGDGSQSPVDSPFANGPCFSHLVANLAVLMMEVTERGPERAALDLGGAHLAHSNLDALATATKTAISLKLANLEGASLPPTVWERASTQGAIPPNGGHTQALVHEYCVTNNLFAPPRFSYDPRDGFVLVPGGSYLVGQQFEHDAPNEPEPSGVQLRSFLMQRYPVTNRQFVEFLKAHPEWGPRKVRHETNNEWYLYGWPDTRRDKRLRNSSWLDRPVTFVSWRAAQAYAIASGLRLPTEVEWEVAARRGQGEAFTSRPWGANIDPGWAWYWNGTRDPPLYPDHTVYELPPKYSEWVLERRDLPAHMIGLVRQWTADRWDPTFPCRAPQMDGFSYLNLGYKWHDPHWRPSGPVQAYHVLRGGSFHTLSTACTAYQRIGQPDTNVNADGGFRCVRPIRVPYSVIRGR